MKNRIRGFILAILFAAVLPACFTMDRGGNDDMQSQGLNFNDVYTNVISPRCLGCHSGAGSGGVNLESYNSVVMYVVSGSPEFSLLYEVTSTGRMPAGGPALSPTQVEMIRNWILLGAP